MSTDINRIEALAAAETLVVKVGTRVLTSPDGCLDRERIAILAEQLCKVMDTGRTVVLVSSGAVGAGIGKLGLTERPRMLADLQAVAAIGQTDLMQAYQHAFAQHGRHAAQVLLTAEDLRNRSSFLNLRNALRQIAAYKAVPIINENDSVAVEELMTTFGDNDRLAASVASLINDAMLVILTDIDGLHTCHPSDPNSKRMSTVETINHEVIAMACDTQNSVSKGGMSSKLVAAQIATSHGHSVIIGPGRDDRVLEKILAGESIGTLFQPEEKPIRGRLRWIDSVAALAGELHVDLGAARAVGERGKSLLAIGIRRVEGIFDRGEVVAIIDPQGNELARGLINYTSEEATKIIGLPSGQIDDVLGHCPFDTVVHCDNIAINNGLPLPR
ncbi:Glutamate 5-kinase [Rosistilla oblonga]|uniref:glutamate 5-kinase n=1 Tax=Rosistilla oblonga TaxID=2527990 RepID=UPI001188F350|nr:glutamate 5-kinase [Rosistilla oblonga]QDV13494.1 Glutamate 5-kinase [Rosistilla oblonga]